MKLYKAGLENTVYENYHRVHYLYRSYYYKLFNIVLFLLLEKIPRYLYPVSSVGAVTGIYTEQKQNTYIIYYLSYRRFQCT